LFLLFKLFSSCSWARYMWKSFSFRSDTDGSAGTWQWTH